MGNVVAKEFEGFLKGLIPMINFAQVEVLDVNDESCSVKVPLIAETKNHLQSMYFGALAVGADAAGGLLAFYHMKQSANDVAIVFKNFQVDFLKRAEGDVKFVCQQGKAVAELVQQAVKTGERQNLPVHIDAIQMDNDVLVATCVLTLSVKAK